MAFTSSSSHDDDDDGMYSSLKAEKADAIRKFNQQQNLFYFGRLLAASLLLLWSFRTLPFLTQIASEYVSLFGQQLCAFLLANAIVIFVYHFSTAAANNTIAAASASVVNLSSSSSLPPSSLRPDIYDEYVSLRQRPTLNGGRVLEEIIRPKPAGADILFPSNISCDEQVKEVDTAGNNLMGEEGLEDGKKEKRLRRTRSVVGEATREKNTFSDGSNYNKGNDDTNKSGERKELRRSETVVMKKRTGAAALALGKSLSFNQARKSIEEMNNDEFNMTVESFIATKKKLLRDENIAATDFNHRHSFAVACPMR